VIEFLMIEGNTCIDEREFYSFSKKKQEKAIKKTIPNARDYLESRF